MWTWLSKRVEDWFAQQPGFTSPPVTGHVAGFREGKCQYDRINWMPLRRRKHWVRQRYEPGMCLSSRHVFNERPHGVTRWPWGTSRHPPL